MVTIAIILIYLTAFASLAIGILVLLSRYDVPTEDVLFVSLLGAGVILLGLLMIALASGLSRGSRFARNLVTVYLVISIGLHVTTILTTDVWDWSAAVQAVIDALIIGVLWLPPGSRFYARRPTTASVPA